ncbi:unnamed protein product [Camellia sinensis]
MGHRGPMPRSACTGWITYGLGCSRFCHFLETSIQKTDRTDVSGILQIVGKHYWIVKNGLRMAPIWKKYFGRVRSAESGALRCTG